MKAVNANHDINPEEVKIICNKRPSDRSSTDILYLEELTANVKVFKNLIDHNGLHSHVLCCRYLRYQFCDQGQYLFKFGDPGTRFYIIIHGKVGVEVPMKNSKGDMHFVEVMMLASGSSFGELALESSKPRAASIKCKIPSHFMYLEKSDYERLISRLVIEKRSALVNFLHNLPIFSAFTKGKLTKLSYIFKERTYTKGQCVYMENDIADELFIIKHGEFEFFKEIKTLNNKTKGKLNKIIVKKVKKIANYGIGEIFGEFEAFQNINRISSCKCGVDNSCVLSVAKSVKGM